MRWWPSKEGGRCHTSGQGDPTHRCPTGSSLVATGRASEGAGWSRLGDISRQSVVFPPHTARSRAEPTRWPVVGSRALSGNSGPGRPAEPPPGRFGPGKERPAGNGAIVAQAPAHYAAVSETLRLLLILKVFEVRPPKSGPAAKGIWGGAWDHPFGPRRALLGGRGCARFDDDYSSHREAFLS